MLLLFFIFISSLLHENLNNIIAAFTKAKTLCDEFQACAARAIELINVGRLILELVSSHFLALVSSKTIELDDCKEKYMLTYMI